MTVVLLGVNHKTAPISLRERLSFSPDGLADWLGRLRGWRGVSECAILSTCNRTELYAASEDAQACSRSLSGFLASTRDLAASEFAPHLYQREGTGAVEHLFGVSSGLDSMILGENQILAQVRSAYQTARQAEATGPVLDRLFPWAVRVGRRARSQTRINEGAASVSQAAVELAGQIFGDLSSRPVLILGAGKMSELTLKHLVSRGVGQLSIVNRDPQRARALAARAGGRALDLDGLEPALAECDVVVSSTGAPHPMITREQLARVMRSRRNRPLFLVDIAVPRDIDPGCESLDNVYLYNIDDLQQAVNQNLSRRHQEVTRVAELIRLETEHFLHELQARRAVPAIRRLREHYDDLRRAELDRVLARHPVSEEERRRLEALSRGLLQKLLHRPTVRLRELGAAGMDSQELIRSLELFGLTPEAYGSGDGPT